MSNSGNEIPKSSVPSTASPVETSAATANESGADKPLVGQPAPPGSTAKAFTPPANPPTLDRNAATFGGIIGGSVTLNQTNNHLSPVVNGGIFNCFNVIGRSEELVAISKLWDRLQTGALSKADDVAEAELSPDVVPPTLPRIGNGLSGLFEKPRSPIHAAVCFAAAFFPMPAWKEFDEIVVELLKNRLAESLTKTTGTDEGNKNESKAAPPQKLAQLWTEKRENYLEECCLKIVKHGDGTRAIAFTKSESKDAAAAYFDIEAFPSLAGNFKQLTASGFIFHGSARVRAGMAGLAGMVAAGDTDGTADEILTELLNRLTADDSLTTSSYSTVGANVRTYQAIAQVLKVFWEFPNTQALRPRVNRFMQSLLTHRKRVVLVGLLRRCDFLAIEDQFGWLRKLVDQGDDESVIEAGKDVLRRLIPGKPDFDANWTAFLRWLPDYGAKPEAFARSSRAAINLFREFLVTYTIRPDRQPVLLDHVMQDEPRSGIAKELRNLFARLFPSQQMSRQDQYTRAVILDLFVSMERGAELSPEGNSWDAAGSVLNTNDRRRGETASTPKDQGLSCWLFFENDGIGQELGVELLIEWYYVAWCQAQSARRDERLRAVIGSLFDQLQASDRQRVVLATEYMTVLFRNLDDQRRLLSGMDTPDAASRQFSRQAILILKSRMEALAAMAQDMRHRSRRRL